MATETGFAATKKYQAGDARRLVEISAGTLIRDDEPINGVKYYMEDLLVKLMYLAEQKGWHWGSIVGGAEYEKALREREEAQRDHDWEERCREAGAVFRQAMNVKA